MSWDTLKFLGTPGASGGGSFTQSMDVTTEIESSVVEDRLSMDIASSREMSISVSSRTTLQADAGPSLAAES